MSRVLTMNRSLSVDTVKKVIPEKKKQCYAREQEVSVGVSVCGMYTHPFINITIV